MRKRISTTLIFCLFLLVAFGQSTGNLYRQKHICLDVGLPYWEPSLKIGNGWDAFTLISAADEGVIYAVNPNGKLFWYKDTGYNKGKTEWFSGNGIPISSDWDYFKKIMCAGKGVIYGVTQSGDLWWMKHTDYLNGTTSWDPNSGNKVGQGWNGLRDYFCGRDGVIYAVFQDGTLKWTKHLGVTNGSAGAAAYVNGGNWASMGINMNNYGRFFTSGDIVYAVENTTNDLYWWRPEAVDSVSGQPTKWFNNGIGRKVGVNWNNYKHIFAINDGFIYAVGNMLTSSEEPVSENKLHLFPTIATNAVNIQFEKVVSGTIEIVDVSGKTTQKIEISDQQSCQLEVMQLPSGWYSIVFRSDLDVHSTRFFKL
jgi:hypothetical protein